MVRYLKWLGIEARVFNVGEYRRQLEPHPSADFFDFNNKEGEKFRKMAAENALADMVKWLKGGQGTIALFDATNSTTSRRKWIKDHCDKEGIETLFVESCCNDDTIITANILEVKTRSPDYVGQDPNASIADFRQRIEKYTGVFQSMNSDGSEEDITYMKIINVGKQVFINQIKCYIQSRVVYYLMNLHIKPRNILLSRVCTIL